MQTDNRVLDSMARFFTNAAGAAQSFRAEVETMVKGRLEKLVVNEAERKGRGGLARGDRDARGHG